MKRLYVGLGLFVVVSFPISSFAAEGKAIPWDLKVLSAAPKVFDDPEHTRGDIKAIFYQGLPWKGHPTRVFAYYGLPKLRSNEKAPAMVLVHGGGGSAYIPWVQLWVGRGYAAIVMDTCGATSNGEYREENHPRHEYGGPPGWGGFAQIDEPIEDQWTYHAVADVILANSLIRSFPQIDRNRIGLTGISWVDTSYPLWQASTPDSDSWHQSMDADSWATIPPGCPTSPRWARKRRASGLSFGIHLAIFRGRTCLCCGWMAPMISRIRWTPCRGHTGCPKVRARSAFAFGCPTDTSRA